MFATGPMKFGKIVKTQTHSHGAIGASVKIGDRVVTPPIAVASILAKLAAGPAQLTDAELSHLPLLNVNVVDATDDMKQARGKELMGKGLDTAWCNAELAMIGKHYKATESISVLNYYAPVS